ncbi:MAG: DUF4179 domain-containing protein [Clostridiales bacterium]|nr:DUF4179 domain-containing protein [Clostridiales bacterium]
MTKKPWHPDDLQQVFPDMPESMSRALMETASSVKEESEMKMRHTLSLALAFVLVFICLMGVALAVFQPQIANIFGQHYGNDFKAWMEEGDVASAEDSVVVEGITFTLNEVATRNHSLYCVGTVTPGEGILLLSDDYPATEPFGYATFHGDKAPEGTPTVLEKAQTDGSTMKQVSISLETIGADGGAMIMPGSWGYDARPMRDGTIQFLFEVEDGVAIPEDARTYAIELRATVRSVSSEGEVDYTNCIDQKWIVEVQPQSFAEVMGTSPQATETPAPAAVEVSATTPQQVIVPDEYTQTGTLPVYKAAPRNFEGKLDYSWFNQSGIAKEEPYPKHTGAMVIYNDEAQLDWSEQAIFYNTYDGTYEATSIIIEGREEKTVTETLQKRTMTSEACSLAGWMTWGFPGTDEVYSLERTELTNITLDQAKAKAEDLLAKLDMNGYTCTTALDMTLERIQTMGNEMNRQIDLGNMFTNNFRYDYSTATVENEGYYLRYHKYGTEGDVAGLFEATFYVTADGVMEINLRDYYVPGEILTTPEKLMDAEAVAKRLPEEMSKSRFPETLVEIRQAELTWMPMRAEKGKDMVMSPVWMLTYVSDDGERVGYTGWAAFSAIDGTLVDAIFN